LPTPSVLSLEVRRLERATVNRLDELRDVSARNPREARKVIERLLDGGKLTFTPLQTEQGKRYQIEGTCDPEQKTYCAACAEAGCPDHQGVPGMSQECRAPGAYGDDDAG
jgi:hypothetical protein